MPNFARTALGADEVARLDALPLLDGENGLAVRNGLARALLARATRLERGISFPVPTDTRTPAELRAAAAALLGGTLNAEFDLLLVCLEPGHQVYGG